MDIRLDPNTGDLDMTTVAGDIILVDGPEAIAQNLRIRFKFFLGEWFLDTRQGLPYFTEVFVKNPRTSRLNFLFRRVILTTAGINDLISFSLSVDTGRRELEVKFRARLTSGGVLDSNDYPPFIVNLDNLGS